jgi:hypothetical protein
MIGNYNNMQINIRLLRFSSLSGILLLAIGILNSLMRWPFGSALLISGAVISILSLLVYAFRKNQHHQLPAFLVFGNKTKLGCIAASIVIAGGVMLILQKKTGMYFIMSGLVVSAADTLLLFRQKE